MPINVDIRARSFLEIYLQVRVYSAHAKSVKAYNRSCRCETRRVEAISNIVREIASTAEASSQ